MDGPGKGKGDGSRKLGDGESRRDSGRVLPAAVGDRLAPDVLGVAVAGARDAGGGPAPAGLGGRSCADGVEEDEAAALGGGGRIDLQVAGLPGEAGTDPRSVDLEGGLQVVRPADDGSVAVQGIEEEESDTGSVALSGGLQVVGPADDASVGVQGIEDEESDEDPRSGHDSFDGSGDGSDD